MMKHIKYSDCDSTQEEVKRHLELSAHEEFELLISTQNQKTGKGRRDHQWEFLPNALAFSFSCAPHPEITWHSLEVCVLLCDFVHEEFGKKILLKWPNDLFYQNKKCGGILLNHLNNHMVVGIGLNLENHHDSLWSGLFDQVIFPGEFQHQIPADFFNFYLKNRMSKSNIEKKWMKSCFHLDRKVEMSDQNHITRGTFKRLGVDGEAIIDNEISEIKFYTGSLKIL